MMSIIAPINSTVNLYLQLLILVILAIGVFFVKRRKFKNHERIMGSAILLALISLIFFMIPAFQQKTPLLTNSPDSSGSQIIIFHVIIGVLAAAFTINILVKRTIASSLHKYMTKPRKTLMKITLIIWVGSFIYGIALFIYYFYQ